MKKQIMSCIKRRCRSYLTVLLCTIYFSRFAMAQVSGTGGGGGGNSSHKWLFIGASTTNHFTANGINSSFTHQLSGKFGIVGDAGVYIGKNGRSSLDKFQLMGGVGWIPATSTGQISISPYVLIGATDTRSVYKSEITSFSKNDLGLSAAVGANIAIPINDHLSFVAKGDYNPSLISGCIDNNFRFGAGLRISLGNKQSHHTTEVVDLRTTEKVPEECKASDVVKKVSFSLDVVNTVLKQAEAAANTVPRVKAEFNISGELSASRGEQCCSKDKPPVPWTALSGSVEASAKITINLWGLPDVDVSITIWPVKLVGKLECKVFVEPSVSLKVSPTGIFYGELGSNPRPDCKSCVYVALNLSANLKFGIRAKLEVGVYHWSPFGGGKAGFDTDHDPDEKFEIGAEASFSVGLSLTGTKTLIGDCDKNTKWHVTMGAVKFNLQFKLTLGPLSFKPSVEVPLTDKYERDI